MKDFNLSKRPDFNINFLAFYILKKTMVKKNFKIIFLGPPGSGKGTQAKMLSKRLRIPLFTAGDIFRQEMKRKTPFARKIAAYHDRGIFVPDQITNQLIKNKLSRFKNNFILDGYPRNLNQARFLDKNFKPNLVFLLELPDKEAIFRISGRRFCPSDGSVYHLKFKKPKKTGICDQCGQRLVQRSDDHPQAVKKRLALYHKKTKPLINYYQKKGVLIIVDGRPRIEAVHREMMKKLKKFLQNQ